jgi:hypothetical protein
LRPSDPRARLAGCLLVACWAALAGPAAPAQLPPVTEENAVVVLVAADLEAEIGLLAEDLRRYERLARSRDRLAGRLSELYRALDVAVTGELESQRDTTEQLMRQVERAEAERGSALVEERLLVERIVERRRTIELLEARLELLEGLKARVEGVLTGTWQVTLLPIEQRGQFRLRQMGTLVSGTYTLSGGQTGSLQGTLVSRKVYLVRIDSKLGRSMEFEGFLSSDGKQIRGSWMSYELADARSSTGEWAATKHEPDR